MNPVFCSLGSSHDLAHDYSNLIAGSGLTQTGNLALFQYLDYIVSLLISILDFQLYPPRSAMKQDLENKIHLTLQTTPSKKSLHPLDKKKKHVRKGDNRSSCIV